MPKERGQSMSTFFAVVVFALLVVSGLVVDGGAQAAASRSAELVAAAAARAASDETATRRLAGRQIDRGAAIAAAQRVIDANAGLSGSVSLSGNGTVLVTTRSTVETVFLSLIGINSLSVGGSAEAQLVKGP